MSVRIVPFPVKPYRPHRADRHAKLVSLYREGRKHSEIAMIYGGTVNGVRSNLRRLRDRGVIA